MTRRHQALVGAALLAAVTSTPVDARQTKQKNIPHSPLDHSHSVGANSYGPHYQERPYPWPTRVKRTPVKAKGASVSAFTNRECLDGTTRTLLNNLETRFGRVALVKVCVPGARMPSGHVSWHARRKAFDFRVPKGVDQRDVMVWLTKNSPGVTISYRGALAGIIHTDTGSFNKVIYAAADHEAGEKAVAIWQERARLGIDVAALPPQRERKSQGRVLQNPSPWTVTADYVEPDFEQFVHPPTDRAPEPIEPGDRRAIFWRSQAYVESRDIVILPHVKFSCPGGKEMPVPIQAMLRDASAHWQRTVRVNSAWRSAAYNRKVGGARQSRHIRCEAVDWRVDGVAPAKLRAWVLSNRHKWKVTGIGTYRTHLHTDINRTRLTEWNGGRKRYAKRKPSRYASAG